MADCRAQDVDLVFSSDRAQSPLRAHGAGNGGAGIVGEVADDAAMDEPVLLAQVLAVVDGKGEGARADLGDAGAEQSGEGLAEHGVGHPAQFTVQFFGIDGGER